MSHYRYLINKIQPIELQDMNLRSKICNRNIWIERDPPPLELFRKLIRFEHLQNSFLANIIMFIVQSQAITLCRYQITQVYQYGQRQDEDAGT